MMAKSTNTVALLLVLLLSMATAFADLSPFESVRADLTMFSDALDDFQSKHGRYPTEEEGLAALALRPSTIETGQWKQLLRTVPKDQWGKDYVYHFPGVRHPGKYDLYSLGKDRISRSGGDDADDIDRWNLDKAEAYYTPHWIEERRPFLLAELGWQLAITCAIGLCLSLVVIHFLRKVVGKKAIK